MGGGEIGEAIGLIELGDLLVDPITFRHFQTLQGKFLGQGVPLDLVLLGLDLAQAGQGVIIILHPHLAQES